MKPVTPIARNWIRALLIVASKTMITTEGVAAILKPPRPGKYMPTPAAMRSADALLVAMKQRGIVRQCHPWTMGKLWMATVWGHEVARVLKRRK